MIEKTTFEFVQMDHDLPMKILHFSQDNLIMKDQLKQISGSDAQSHFVPMHWHKELEVTYIVKGSLELRKNNQTKVYQDGTFFVINTGEIHELKGSLTPNVEIICFLISYDFVESYLPNIDHMYFDLETTQETYVELEKLFVSILHQHQTKEPFSSVKIQSDLLELLYLLSVYHLKEGKQEQLAIYSNNQLNQDILSFIHEHYDQKLSLTDVAHHFNFSKEHFARSFKENFSRTFLSYLTDYRLYRAFPDIMKGTKTIEIISQEHGFPSSKALIRHFKSTYHETPVQYRKNHEVIILDHNDS